MLFVIALATPFVPIFYDTSAIHTHMYMYTQLAVPCITRVSQIQLFKYKLLYLK